MHHSQIINQMPKSKCYHNSINYNSKTKHLSHNAIDYKNYWIKLLAVMIVNAHVPVGVSYAISVVHNTKYQRIYIH